MPQRINGFYANRGVASFNMRNADPPITGYRNSRSAGLGFGIGSRFIGWVASRKNGEAKEQA